MDIATWPDEPCRPQPPGFPYPPMREVPKREGPLMVPMVDLPGDDVETHLFARRRVLLSGVLDGDAANRVAAQLMALDGRSAEPIEIVVNSDGGPIADVLTLLDIVGLMRAPVRTVCVGRATGTAAVLVACGTGGRHAAPNALDVVAHLTRRAHRGLARAAPSPGGRPRARAQPDRHRTRRPRPVAERTSCVVSSTTAARSMPRGQWNWVSSTASACRSAQRCGSAQTGTRGGSRHEPSTGRDSTSCSTSISPDRNPASL